MTKPAASDSSDPLSSQSRRVNVGKTQAAILSLLTTAEEDGLTTAHLATALGISERAAIAAARRLKDRDLAVISSQSAIVWLPGRRLKWLKTRALQTKVTVEEIHRLERVTRSGQYDPF